MYNIAVDADKDLITVTFAGLLSAEEAARYISDIKTAMIVNRIRSPYRMVIDVAGSQLQSQDTLRALGSHMTTMPKASTLAIVTGNSLVRMQVRRLMTQPYARIVATMPEALAWVLKGVEPAKETALRTAPIHQAVRNPTLAT